MQDFIINQVEGPLSEFMSDSSRVVKLEPIVTQAVNALKSHYDGIWQMVILEGSYSAFSCYVANRLFHIKLGRFVILTWQSSTY